ncbi:hypothetical protein [Exiguobacterium sp. NG55]|uniref:Ig-like domain-containing protein n=1 Tax=Exiguobacterium sp. NG55 TaxID=375477 RepID=UPI000A54AF2A|nr:hypothetical protein [Exiguobacterium sp. NG55]
MNNIKYARPTSPWRNSSEPYTGAGVGNIPSYPGGNIEIRNTLASEADQIYWREVNDGSRKLLIADRVLCVDVSWNTLHTQNLILGKTITIDGQQYLVRSLTGGSNYRNSDTYLGGTPTTNEWDRFITNEANVPGLPIPVASDLDTTLNSTDKNSAHNQFWNWMGVYSWTQETYASDGSYRSSRGSYSARFWNGTSATSVSSNFGWRPVLEVLNSAPVISGTDSNLGSKAAPFTQAFTINDADAGNTFGVTVRLNGVTKQTLTNQSNGAFSYDLAPDWANLSLGTHTLSVTATDNSGASSVRTWTFTKTNSPAGKPQITNLANGMRVKSRPIVEFMINSDAESDSQSLKLQIANDINFTNSLSEQTGGFEILNDGIWTSITTLANEHVGIPLRVRVDADLPLNTKRFLRITSVDSGSTSPSHSDPVEVKVGDSLDFETIPEVMDFEPTRIFVLLERVIDPAAAIRVFASRSADQPEPVWEEMTSSYESNVPYEFLEAGTRAVAVKVTVEANGATGMIDIKSIAIGVN